MCKDEGIFKELENVELRRGRYNKTHQAHPDTAHTDSKEFFKRKGRKRQRRSVAASLDEIKDLYNNS